MSRSVEIQNTIDKIKKHAQEERDRVIAVRSTYEQQFEKLAQNLPKADPELLKKIPIPAEISARALFPSLYKNPPNIEEYEREREALKPFLIAMEKVMNELLEKGKEAMNG